MRILINAVYLTSERLGGSWTYTTQLVKHLSQRRGGDEYFVTINDRVASAFDVSPVAGEKIVISLDAQSRIKRIGWEPYALPELIRKYNIDLLHAPANTLPLGHFRCAKVTSIHDLQVFHYPENFPLVRRLYLRTMLPRTVAQSHRVIASSDFTRRDILSRFRVDTSKVVTIPLAGFPAHLPEASTASEVLIHRYDLRSPYLLSVGSSLPHKNLVRLVESFARIASHIPHSLVIVGEGFSHRTRITEALDRSGIQSTGRVRLLDYVPGTDLAGLYRMAWAFVFPSLFEGFGIPAIEAMASGCPVVSSRATSLAEVVGNAGLLFDPLQPESIDEALLQICRDQNLREQLARAGKDRALHFSWEATARRTEEIYLDTIQNYGQR